MALEHAISYIKNIAVDGAADAGKGVPKRH
jgi:hypothetical protein